MDFAGPQQKPWEEEGKMSRKGWIGLAALVAVAVGWYAFRPERLFVNQKINEQFPAVEKASSSAPVELVSGRFHSAAHETKGVATIYRLPDGKRALRLTQFETSNGPEVQVYLGVAPDAKDNETVTKAGFVTLGAMKGNIGDQNYDIPADVDLAKYHSVTIWCHRFGVNFGTAPIAAAATGPVALSMGSFHGVAHETKGVATLYQLADGKRVLRLTEFATSNGPEVQVYLGAASDAKDNETVTKAGFVTLGAIKGNIGDQNYDVPSDLDLAKYHSVTIWCHRFGVNFGTAPLSTATAGVAAPARQQS
jgi:electron transfer DM13